jgi:hypothetical protein
MSTVMGVKHVDYPHNPGMLPDCPACDLMEDRKEMQKAERRITAHLKTCTTCEVGSDPKWCGVIQPTVTEYEEKQSLFAGLAELEGKDY